MAKYRRKRSSKPSDYPAAWQAGIIQQAIRLLANHTCEWCGIKFHQGTNIAIEARNRAGKPIIGTVHHINAVKDDLRWANLVYLCQTCHMRVEPIWRPGDVIPVKWLIDGDAPMWIKKRGLPYEVKFIQHKF